METPEKLNYLQVELEKYDRRAKKVSENPDPKLMKINKLYYELWRDHRKRQVQAWERGEPFVYCQATAIRPLVAMGLHPIEMAELADRVRPNISMRYFNKARSVGFPSDICDWCQVGSGMALMGEIPAPALVYAEYCECGITTQQALWMARHFKVPFFGIDVPIELNWRNLEYVTRQLEDMIAEIERLLPGHKYDEAKHKALLARDLEVQNYVDEILELSKVTPTPLAGKDAVRMAPLEIDDDRLPEYYRQLRDEIKQRLEEGNFPLSEEKARLYWLAAIPNFTDPFGFLEKRGIASPLFEEAPGVSGGNRLGRENQERYGRKLTPLQEEAAFLSSRHWGGTAERRLEDVMRWSKKYKIDGLVHLMMPGCPTCIGTARIIADKARDELGIPTLITDGWIQDYEKFNEPEFQAKLEAFTDMIVEKKKDSDKES